MNISVKIGNLWKMFFTFTDKRENDYKINNLIYVRPEWIHMPIY